MNEVIALNINLRSISFEKNKQNLTILQDLYIDLKSREIVAVIGPNGIGKTTLLNSILLFLGKEYKINGSIQIFGKELVGLPEKELSVIRKEKVKYIFQDAFNCFDPLRMLKYYFQNSLNNRKLLEYSSYFLLNDLDVLLNKYPFELSSGMAQRLAIIWGIISEPSILLLDEPTSALDSTLINLLSYKLKDWVNCNNSSILFTTQNKEFAINTATRIIELSDYHVNRL